MILLAVLPIHDAKATSCLLSSLIVVCMCGKNTNQILPPYRASRRLPTIDIFGFNAYIVVLILVFLVLVYCNAKQCNLAIEYLYILTYTACFYTSCHFRHRTHAALLANCKCMAVVLKKERTRWRECLRESSCSSFTSSLIASIGKATGSFSWSSRLTRAIHSCCV